MFSRKGTYPAIAPSPRRRVVHLLTDWRRVACRQGEVKGDLYATRSPLEVTCPRCKKAASHETFTSVYSDKPGHASGRTIHLVTGPRAKYTFCGERAHADTSVESIKDANCFYCSTAWKKAHDAEVRERKHRAGRAGGTKAKNYFTVIIPYARKGATRWHPTTSTGPFATLSRGSFSTVAEAKAWAEEHLGKTEWSVREITAGRAGGTKNREGLTFEEWVVAAGFPWRDSYGLPTRARNSSRLRAAFLAGEDPTEWRAAPPKDFAKLSTHKNRLGSASGVSYTTHDPRGWGGDPKRGAALGRPSVRGAADFAGHLHLQRVRLDRGGYDSNGTYFGLGPPLYWYASEDGSIDDMLRAGTRESAKKQILDRYPNARFYR